MWVKMAKLNVADLLRVEEIVGFKFVDPGTAEAPNEVDIAIIQRLVERSGYAIHRIIPPNIMVTMDYRTDRVNINIDENGIIESVDAG